MPQKRGKGKKKRTRKVKRRNAIMRGVPEKLVRSYTYQVTPQALFYNMQYGNVNLSLNDMSTFEYGGGAINTPYFDHDTLNYTRYIVTDVVLDVRLINRDTTASVVGEVLLVPTAETGITVGSSATYTVLAAMRHAIRRPFGLPTSGQSIIRLKARYRMSSIFGREYLTNETYAGVSTGPGPATPTTSLVACLAVAATGTFTNSATTGGLWADIRIVRKVRNYNLVANTTMPSLDYLPRMIVPELVSSSPQVEAPSSAVVVLNDRLRVGAGMVGTYCQFCGGKKPCSC